ncbi:MAG: hypothetical protein AB1352_02350 [Patescibacteria group bacterium]
MDWIVVLSAMGFTVVSSDSSIPYWRYTVGLSSFWTSVIVIIITSISSTIIFKLGGMIGKRKKPRKNRKKIRTHRKVRASIYVTKKRLLAKIARNYGLPAAIFIAAFWPTVAGGWEVHLPALILASRTRDKKLLIAYLLGNAMRIIFANVFLKLIEQIF